MGKTVSLMRIEVENKVGKLAELTDALKAAGIDIRAVCAWVEGAGAKMLLVTGDNDKACATLSDKVTSCEMVEALAVTVPNQIGALNAVAAKVAEAGIAINFCFATTGGGEVMVLLDTADNARAAQVI